MKSVDTRDLKQFEPPRGNARSETRQIRRTPPAPCPANAEPSLPAQEGVESRRRAPKAARPGRRRAPAHERRLFPSRKAAGGESRSGKKIPGRKACRFDSGLRHHFFAAARTLKTRRSCCYEFDSGQARQTVRWRRFRIPECALENGAKCAVLHTQGQTLNGVAGRCAQQTECAGRTV